MADLVKLRELAGRADEGYPGADPRDSNNWQANEEFCRAASPEVVLALVEVAEAANNMEAALGGFGSFPTAVLLALAPLRSSLEKLERV